jgi:hypothetical protein
MKNATKKPVGWSAVRRQIATWEKPVLLALVKDLYEAGTEIRDFIQARCQAGEGDGKALEKYRSKIVDRTCGVWNRPESPQKTVTRVREGFRKSMERHQSCRMW